MRHIYSFVLYCNVEINHNHNGNIIMRLNAKIIAAAIAITCQTPFAQTSDVDLNDKITKLSGTIESINGELNSQRASLSSLKSEVENSKIQKRILEELKAVQRQNQYVYDTLLSQNESNGGKMIKPLRNYDIQTPDGKMILGQDEYVYVKEANATIVARIDTGASQSSISASDIVEFERNGKKWIRFNIVHNDRTVEVEAPYVKQTRLRQSSMEEFSYRPVVKLNVKIGDYSTEAEFNLIDRSKMQYALLIGRNLLTDIAVVDVARRYVQERADKEGLLLVKIDDYEDSKKKGINLNQKYDDQIKNNAGGQKATLSEDHTQSLGTDPNKALPAVTDKIKTSDGSKPAIKKDKDIKRVNSPKEKSSSKKSAESKK